MTLHNALPSQEETNEVELLRSQLESMHRLATLGELTSTTTHEFNNLLMTILNYAKLGLRHSDDATREKALQRILDAACRAARLSRTVLGMARGQNRELEPTELATIIDDVLLLMERELSKYRIAVDKQIDACPPVLANGNDIQRVLINLLTNARQAIGERGEVRIRLQGDVESGYAVLTIRDTGAGIPAEVLPHIFDPYFTTKDRPDETGKGGTGIGLAICKKIIDRHRGKIRVESSPGKGTAFVIRIPLATTTKAKPSASETLGMRC